MSTTKVPYVRPGDLATNDFDYHVRVVQDGTRTVAELYEGKAEDHYDWQKPIGVGHAVRRKGEKRKPNVGATLAMSRALQNAADNAKDAAEKALNGAITL